MKLALAVVIAVILALVVAVRIPASARYLDDVPGLDLVVELIGYHDDGPTELQFRFDHPVSSDAEARARDVLARRLAPLAVEIRGDRLAVIAPAFDDVMRASSLHTRHAPLRVFVVVYQSPELDALRTQLRTDKQAQALGLSVELDHVGYHVHAQSNIMDVNSDWAAAHHCEGTHYEGTGTACVVTPKQRFEAYVRGDPGLFTDPHPIALPPGRDFYLVDTGDYYELETAPIEISPLQITATDYADDALVLSLTGAAAAAIAARAVTPDVELVVETTPGKLRPATASPGKLAIALDRATAAELALDLQLAATGLVAVP